MHFAAIVTTQVPTSSSLMPAHGSSDSLPSVLAFNLGHDGAVASLRDGRLVFSLEAEKDSHRRHLNLGADLFFDAICKAGRVPDVVAISGWRGGPVTARPSGPAYEGVEGHHATFTEIELFGTPTLLFRSTHERSHLFCSYGLSPFENREPCYALVWEGQIGSFYEINETLTIRKLKEVLRAPGYKYSFLFDLADPTRSVGGWRHDAAGKLMALAAYSSRGQVTRMEDSVIQRILTTVLPPTSSKAAFTDSPYFNCGVTDEVFTELVGKFSDRLFRIFYEYAKRHLTKGFPLLIAGGCGLNCEWNSLWRDSGLFRDVFVPPIANDSGAAVGTAIDAQFALSGRAKIGWDVYRGLEFQWDHEPDGFDVATLDVAALAGLLAADHIVAWVQGKYEIGPRALGNRSLLAAPFAESMTARLNGIKRREPYRPIAPVCVDEEAHRCFGVSDLSPYMLYFFKVRAPELRAVTHVDGSARVQTLSETANPRLYSLLCAFRERTGFGVLCNTSLNFPDRGFINRSSDLFAYAVAEGIDTVVVDDRVYTRAR